MTVRAAISKRLRFDVFKRDGFVCQYCGSHPPAVVLEVDHINPVSNGGATDIDNLITSCFACNRGKAAEPLTVVPQSLAEKAVEVAEREAQILGYAQVMEDRRQRIEDDAWKIVDAFDGPADDFRRDWFRSVKTFVDRLGYHETLEAMEIARGRMRSKRQRFAYFCGICWRKIKAVEGGPTQ